MSDSVCFCLFCAGKLCDFLSFPSFQPRRSSVRWKHSWSLPCHLRRVRRWLWRWRTNCFYWELHGHVQLPWYVTGPIKRLQQFRFQLKRDTAHFIVLMKYINALFKISFITKFIKIGWTVCLSNASQQGFFFYFHGETIHWKCMGEVPLY